MADIAAIRHNKGGRGGMKIGSIREKKELPRRGSLTERFGFGRDSNKFGHSSLLDDNRLGSGDIQLKAEMVMKLRSDGSWQPRKLVLTPEMLCFTLEEDGPVVDWIPLHEIAAVFAKDSTSYRESGDGGGTSKKLTRSLSVQKASSGSTQLSDFQISTTSNGFNSGRTYAVRTQTTESRKEWIDEINVHSKKRIKQMKNQSRLEEWKEWARATYASSPFQSILVFLISFNFLINAIQAQVQPEENSNQAATFENLDIILTVCFATELAFNAFGHWFWAFVQDGWSMFDLFVVTLSVLALAIDQIPGVSILRIMRAFRILRLIGRFQKLKRIINAILVSIIPVLNAFLIGLLVTLIYAIIGVQLYGERSPDNFSTFARSMFSLFLLMAFDRWTDDLPAFDERGKLDFGVVIFLFSFVVIVLWTLVQVVVAVLLDNFIAATIAEKQAKAIERQKRNRTVTHALDPVLERICSGYDTTQDLSKRISQIFNVLDNDQTGMVGYQKMHEGFRRLNLKPSVHLSKEDFESIAADRLNDKEELTCEEFEAIMRVQLNHYVQRVMADAVAMANAGPEIAAMLSALKLMLLATDEHQETERIRRTASAVSATPEKKPSVHSPRSEQSTSAHFLGPSNPAVPSDPADLEAWMMHSEEQDRRIQDLEQQLKEMRKDVREGFEAVMRRLAQGGGAHGVQRDMAVSGVLRLTPWQDMEPKKVQMGPGGFQHITQGGMNGRGQGRGPGRGEGGGGGGDVEVRMRREREEEFGGVQVGVRRTSAAPPTRGHPAAPRGSEGGRREGVDGLQDLSAGGRSGDGLRGGSVSGEPTHEPSLAGSSLEVEAPLPFWLGAGSGKFPGWQPSQEQDNEGGQGEGEEGGREGEGGAVAERPRGHVEELEVEEDLPLPPPAAVREPSLADIVAGGRPLVFRDLPNPD